MSGGSLPRTGTGAVALAVPGTGLAWALPLPLVIALVAGALIVAGALMIRLTWRRRRPVAARGWPRPRPRRGGGAGGGAVRAAAAIWAIHHALAAANLLTGVPVGRYATVYAVMYGLLLWQLGLAYLETPATATRRRQRLLDELHVVAIVPTYNEDVTALRACLESMIGQSRRPQQIWVVDDGSPETVTAPVGPPWSARRRAAARVGWWAATARWWLRRRPSPRPVLATRPTAQVPGPAAAYGQMRHWFYTACREAGIHPRWIRTPNRGKRHAQGAAIIETTEADIYWTVDSDTVSDPEALHQLLLPMADPRVQSVAGIVMAANVRQSLLTRFTDLWFVTGQLTDRSALSALGSVWVNSGPIAVYRARTLRRNLDGYLNETFFSRPVPFSDDSMLTLYAMLAGRTVQQPTAYAYSLMPETVNHHWRQFERWMRGSFIRSWWRVRYLRVGGAAWWMHLLRWVTTAAAVVIFVDVAIVRQVLSPSWETAAWLATVPMIIGYAQCLRYMIVRRSDQPPGYQWRTWLLAPIAVLWSMTVLRACRWWAVATVLRIGWGTRATVEVTMRPAAAR